MNKLASKNITLFTMQERQQLFRVYGNISDIYTAGFNPNYRTSPYPMRSREPSFLAEQSAAPTPIVTAEQGGVAATANGRKTASSIANKLVKPIKTAETNIGSGKGGSSKLSSEQIRVNNSKSNKMIGKGVDKSKNARLPIGKENTP
uniref:Uncharacterized protein n=1 Tax=Meloidogyne javanica TaxID=6303 RepID=A0A915LGU5_MELJA